MTPCVNLSTGEYACQEEFEMIDGRRKWKERKEMTNKVARMMAYYDPDRANELKRCGTYLTFARDGDALRLHDANFCRQRLCPMCQWRRSLRLAHQADEIYRAEVARGYHHVFVTLTVRNCTADKLNETIDQMYKRAAEWQRSRPFKRSFLGHYRAFEVTYNRKDDTYHPHFHYIMTVAPDYFRADNPNYVTGDRLIKMWRKAAHLDYDPSVSIEAVRQKDGQPMTSACVEACKYPVKSVELPNWHVLCTVDHALRGRRLIQWCGVTADVRHALALEDVEDGDLVHVEDDSATSEDLDKIVYVWRHGVYLPLEVYVVNEDAE